MSLRSSGVRLALPWALAALFLSLAVSARAATPASDLATYADQVLSAAYPADQPGAAALVVQNGKVVLRKGYGLANLDLGVPVSPDMVFELGSITKQFTAASILLLQVRAVPRIGDPLLPQGRGCPGRLRPRRGRQGDRPRPSSGRTGHAGEKEVGDLTAVSSSRAPSTGQPLPWQLSWQLSWQ